MQAYQWTIRQQEAAKHPRETIQSLSGCRVEAVTKLQAQEIIARYEWLAQDEFGASFGRSQANYGLLSPSGEILGVVSFGLSGGTNANNICKLPAKTICLERGACVHFAPKYSASFLIRGACKLAYRDRGWEVFYAYADEEAGEFGYVYQASNWYYLGFGPGRKSKGKGNVRNFFVDPATGKRITSRVMRHRFKIFCYGCGTAPCKEKSMTQAAKDSGLVHLKLKSKHKYVWFEGPRRRLLRASCRYLILHQSRYPKNLDGVVS